ncbi:MAG: MotA/TolQ/ExbB proton channel family protein [Isosphaeraceae bacterium]|nr:MotA/TolQ/ExbB proton channel family protein [Isosphaeraceae bacterium]
MRFMVRSGFVPLLAFCALLGLGLARAQEARDDAPATPTAPAQAAAPARKATPAPGTVGKDSLLQLVKQANPMLWPLGVCSVVALGYTLERLIALRRGRVIPKDFVHRFHERLAAGKLDRERALELCRAHDSPVARILGHVVKHWGQPAALIRQSLGYEAAGELLDLKRNIRVLNGTATLAPLLGLLGTVIGLIESFDALRHVGAGKNEALAHGISVALLSTAFGLAIAIVSVAAYYYLLNRVDVLARELDDQAGRVIDLVAAEVPRPLADRRLGASQAL